MTYDCINLFIIKLADNDIWDICDDTCTCSMRCLLFTNLVQQKQPPKEFYKKSCCKTFCNIHRKTPMLRTSGLKIYEKNIPTQVLSCEYCEIFKNIYFEKHLRTAASGSNFRVSRSPGSFIFNCFFAKFRKILTVAPVIQSFSRQNRRCWPTT